MNIVDRLKIYIEHVGLPISQFADAAQIPRPTLSQILSGRNRKVSNELLEKLHAAFPRLNVSWFLFGDGDMENNDIPQVVRQPQQNPATDKVSAPTLPFGTPEEQQVPQPASLPQEEPSALDQKHFEPLRPSSLADVAIATDSSKKVQLIMVYYNDNSYEVFKPAK